MLARGTPSGLPAISPARREISSFIGGTLFCNVVIAKARVTSDLPPCGGDVRQVPRAKVLHSSRNATYERDAEAPLFVSQ
jgi:hypothetical protein